jgi:hypothetical protein
VPESTAQYTDVQGVPQIPLSAELAPQVAQRCATV